MAKKKKPVQSLNMNGKSKSKTEKYELPGCESYVDQIREIDKQMEKLIKDREQMKQMILNKVIPTRQREEKAGRLFKTFVILGNNNTTAQVVFKNAFSKIPAENEETMRKELGECFEDFYQVTPTTA
ncbi:MAG: hypothetical protein KAR08_06800, partial [Candidatus Heimdallarchaeota archaeon]|nr:hypothetical protein [Candidatus Heimdallarchaeota archaeon]